MPKPFILWLSAFWSILFLFILGVFVLPPSLMGPLPVFVLGIGGISTVICGYRALTANRQANIPQDNVYEPDVMVQKWLPFLFSSSILFFGFTAFILTDIPFSLLEEYCDGVSLEAYARKIDFAMYTYHTDRGTRELMFIPNDVIKIGYCFILGILFVIPRKIRHLIYATGHLSIFYWYSPILFSIGRNIKIMQHKELDSIMAVQSLSTVFIFIALHLSWYTSQRALGHCFLPILAVILGYFLAESTFLIGLKNLMEFANL